MEETMDVGDIIGLLPLLTGVLLTLLHLDNVTNLGVVTNTQHSPSLKNILTEVIHHDVTNLHGLHHLVILAIHSVVDHQHT